MLSHVSSSSLKECVVITAQAPVSTTEEHITDFIKPLITGSSPSNVSSKKMYFGLLERARRVAAWRFIPFEKEPSLTFSGSLKASISSLKRSLSNVGNKREYSLAILVIVSFDGK